MKSKRQKSAKYRAQATGIAIAVRKDLDRLREELSPEDYDRIAQLTENRYNKSFLDG